MALCASRNLNFQHRALPLSSSLLQWGQREKLWHLVGLELASMPWWVQMVGGTFQPQWQSSTCRNTELMRTCSWWPQGLVAPTGCGQEQQWPCRTAGEAEGAAAASWGVSQLYLLSKSPLWDVSSSFSCCCELQTWNILSGLSSTLSKDHNNGSGSALIWGKNPRFKPGFAWIRFSSTPRISVFLFLQWSLHSNVDRCHSRLRLSNTWKHTYNQRISSQYLSKMSVWREPCSSSSRGFDPGCPIRV